MSQQIYLIQETGELVPLHESPYGSEQKLQELIAAYPDLLPGEQMDEADPRRWLLICREAGLPLEKDGGDALSLDHLFLDQDGVPTLVEVKRASDTRIRREVVGQMLDYAACAVDYWSADTIPDSFEAACEGDPTVELAAFLGLSEDDGEVIDDFWANVQRNLRAGKIRLVFAADEIPPELRHIVEFLGRFLNPVEVFAVEIKQFTGETLRTMVPRVLGRPKPSSAAKRPTKQWDEPSFFAELGRRKGPTVANVARRLLERARRWNLDIWWGRGARSGSFVPNFDHLGTNHQLFAVWTYGVVEIYFQWYQNKDAFASEEKRQEILERLNAIPGVDLPDDSIGRRPSIPLEALEPDDNLEQFCQVFQWMIAEIRSHSENE